MDTTTSLLAIAGRVTAASAAIVAALDDDAPVAAWGCDDAAARSLLRVLRAEPAGGPTLFAVLPVSLADGTPGRLVLVAPGDPGAIATLDALAAEIGATCTRHGAIAVPSAIDRLIESTERLGDAIGIFATPLDPERTSQFIHVNAAFTRLFGYTESEVAGTRADVLNGALTDMDRTQWIRSRIAARQQARAVNVFYTRDGTPLWTEFTSTPFDHDGGDVVHHVVTFRDVTSRKQFEDALASEKRKLQTTLAAIADAVVTVLPDGRIEFVNATAQRLLGIELADAYGARFDEIVPIVDAQAQPVDLIGNARGGERAFRGQGHLRTNDGVIDVAYVSSRVDGERDGVVIVLRDVTTEHRLTLRLSFEASHDILTGLPNRRAMLERLENAVEAARTQNAKHVVAFIDLDRFKIVNDRFGHATGDRLLREVARVMGRVVRGGDVLARIGGDEFALLLSDCTIPNARRVAEKMRRAVEAYRIEHDGEVLDVGVSVGLAPIDADTVGATQALADADRACYKAKAAGRNAVAG